MYVGRVGIKGVVAVVGGSAGDLAAEPLAAGNEGILAGAKELGAQLGALQSAHLLTSGGGGVAKAVSEGFYGVHPRSGIILAIVPGAVSKTDAGESPNDYVEIPIFAPFGSDPTVEGSTASIAVKTADVVVALPGAEDTLALLDLATKAKFKYSKPTIVYLPSATDTVGGKNASALKRSKYTVTDSVDEVVEFVKTALAATGR